MKVNSNENLVLQRKNPILNEEDDNVDKINQEDKKTNINCLICKLHESKYKCPRCQIRTCCLNCVREHKKIFKCSGVRDKFSKKALKDFSENDFVRDMNFINNTINETNRIEKNLYNSTEENQTEIITIHNKTKVNSGIAFTNNDENLKDCKDKKNDKIKEDSKSLVKDCKNIFFLIITYMLIKYIQL